ncbi:MAG: helix-turn-helix domain-containing protein, partial [Planctomycetota bacterium]|nr:helix-turn-helix domain-containing protein [Planctomycetota bacterium]
MASKFVELSQAAQQLGMTADELNEARNAGEVHGFRDGSSWKFKPQELERFAEERGVSLGADDNFDDLLDDLEIDGGGGSSVLVSDEELGAGQESPSSTIIGENSAGAADSDLRLVPAEDEGDDISLDDDDDDLQLEPLADSTGSDLSLDDEDEDDLSLEPATGTGELGAASDELDLDGLDDEEDLTLDIGGGSDVTLGTGDSGINLASPADSGLSLEEEPLEIGSSASGLELPEDDEVISLGAEAGPDDATQLKQEDEFLLSADETDDDAGDESSGSQVIDLEDSAAFEESGEGAGLTPAGGGLEAELQSQAGGVDASMGLGQPAPTYGGSPETPYSAWNVAALMFILLLLSVSGLVMIDLIRSLDTWEGEQ